MRIDTACLVEDIHIHMLELIEGVFTLPQQCVGCLRTIHDLRRSLPDLDLIHIVNCCLFMPWRVVLLEIHLFTEDRVLQLFISIRLLDQYGTCVGMMIMMIVAILIGSLRQINQCDLLAGYNLRLRGLLLLW